MAAIWNFLSARKSFHMSSRTSIVSLVLIRHKHCRHRALKFLIGQSFENVFSRTEEGIGMKLGT
jgi:hypothetical protein